MDKRLEVFIVKFADILIQKGQWAVVALGANVSDFQLRFNTLVTFLSANDEIIFFAGALAETPRKNMFVG